jgi:hypothetical protein
VPAVASRLPQYAGHYCSTAVAKAPGTHATRDRPANDPPSPGIDPQTTRPRPANVVAQKTAAKAGQGGSIGHAVAGLGGCAIDTYEDGATCADPDANHIELDDLTGTCGMSLRVPIGATTALVDGATSSATPPASSTTVAVP